MLVSSSLHSLGGVEGRCTHPWKTAAPSRRVGPVAVKVLLRLAGCVKHSSLPFLLPVTGLRAAPCPWTGIWWVQPPSLWQAVVSLQLCSGTGAPCSIFSSLLAAV